MRSCYEVYGGYYHFSQIGTGQIQFLRCEIDRDNNLQKGRLADSYSIENEKDKKWKDTVYKILKKLGYRAHWYYYDGNNNLKLSERPDTRLVAYKGAIEKYNEGKFFMVDNRVKYIGKIKFTRADCPR